MVSLVLCCQSNEGVIVEVTLELDPQSARFSVRQVLYVACEVCQLWDGDPAGSH